MICFFCRFIVDIQAHFYNAFSVKWHTSWLVRVFHQLHFCFEKHIQHCVWSGWHCSWFLQHSVSTCSRSHSNLVRCLNIVFNVQNCFFLCLLKFSFIIMYIVLCHLPLFLNILNTFVLALTCFLSFVCDMFFETWTSHVLFLVAFYCFSCNPKKKDFIQHGITLFLVFNIAKTIYLFCTRFSICWLLWWLDKSQQMQLPLVCVFSVILFNLRCPIVFDTDRFSLSRFEFFNDV